MSDAVRSVGHGLAARERPGPGSRVLWLHGYTLTSASWRTMWSLLPGWHHIGLDLPGHGGSDPVGPDDDIQTLGRRVADVCLEQDIRHIVALSFGTLTATQVMLEEPDHFRSVTLAAPALAGGPQDPEVGMGYAQLAHLYHSVGPGEKMRDVWMRNIAWEGIDALPELREELGTLVAAHQWPELKDWGMMRLMRPPHTAEALARFEAPVLVIIGEKDRPAFHECAATLRGALPRCEQLTLDGIHHLCMLEAPEASAEAVARHLEAHDRRAA